MESTLHHPGTSMTFRLRPATRKKWEAIAISSKTLKIHPKSALSALARVAAAAILSLSTACSHSEPMTPPLASGASASATAMNRDAGTGADPRGTTEVFRDGTFTTPLATRRGLADRTLSKIAKEVQKMQRLSIENPFDYYRDNVRNAQNSFGRAEESAGSIGIDRTAFRQGIAVTTAGAATALGALYFLKPAGLSDHLLWTRFKVGYDVCQIDDPKMYVTYNDDYSIGVTRNGLGGSIRGESGRIYSADLNIMKPRASVKMTF